MNQLVQELNSSLKAIEPKGAEVKPITQIITYSLIATALVGIAVYSYIKQAEKQELSSQGVLTNPVQEQN